MNTREYVAHRRHFYFDEPPLDHQRRVRREVELLHQLTTRPCAVNLRFAPFHEWLETARRELPALEDAARHHHRGWVEAAEPQVDTLLEQLAEVETETEVRLNEAEAAYASLRRTAAHEREILELPQHAEDERFLLRAVTGIGALAGLAIGFASGGVAGFGMLLGAVAGAAAGGAAGYTWVWLGQRRMRLWHDAHTIHALLGAEARARHEARLQAAVEDASRKEREWLELERCAHALQELGQNLPQTPAHEGSHAPTLRVFPGGGGGGGGGWGSPLLH